ncbi:hypothetical protein CSKR_110033 [Clonorchis sinensis]|uniref:Uncharacterized protein n=1 Tax=Clonorchis sinensis TaxID=79923 RepID=A0A3R7CAN9_CLOSI|nr:hypothetical protein CSKR_110033 [Clonorchis sinensis]
MPPDTRNMLLLSFYFFLVAPLPKLQTSTAVAQTPRRTVIHSNWLVPGLHSHGPPTKGKLSVTLHPSDSLCQSPSHPDPAATELRIPSPIAAPLTTVTGLSINRSISVASVSKSDASLPYNHDSFESLIVKKRIKAQWESRGPYPGRRVAPATQKFRNHLRNPPPGQGLATPLLSPI